jgi:hypothetical protein
MLICGILVRPNFRIVGQTSLYLRVMRIPSGAEAPGLFVVDVLINHFRLLRRRRIGNKTIAPAGTFHCSSRRGHLACR